MNKKDAVEFLKIKGLQAISVSTLDRHRKEGRVVAQQIKGKTGDIIDYPEEALLAYLDVEMGPVASPVKVLAKPSLLDGLIKPSQSLAKASHESLSAEIRSIAIIDEVPQNLAKVPVSLSEIMIKVLWTVDEAAAVTGASKGSIRDAIKAGEVAGGINGGKLKVNGEDALRWARGLFKPRQGSS